MIFKAPNDGQNTKRSNEQSSPNSQVSERNFDTLSQPEGCVEQEAVVAGANNIPYQMDTDEPTMLDMEDAVLDRKKLLCEKRSYTASAAAS